MVQTDPPIGRLCRVWSDPPSSTKIFHPLKIFLPCPLSGHLNLWSMTWVTDWVTNRRKSLSCYSQLKIMWSISLRVSWWSHLSDVFYLPDHHVSLVLRCDEVHLLQGCSVVLGLPHTEGRLLTGWVQADRGQVLQGVVSDPAAAVCNYTQ